MYEIKRLKEQKLEHDSVKNEIKAAIEKDSRPMTDDEINRFDAADDAIAVLEAQIKTAERLDKPAKSRPVSAPVVERKSNKGDLLLAQRAWLLNHASASGNPEWVARAAELNFPMDRNTIVRTDFGQDLGTSGQGPELTDGDVFVGLVHRLKNYGGMRKVAKVMTTANGSPIHYAYNDDTGNEASIIGENTAITSVPETFSTVALASYTYRSGSFPVSYELIQDSKVNIVEEITGRLAIRIGRRQNADFTTGDGSGKPRGFTLDAATGRTTAANNAIVYGEVNDLFHSVDVDYRDLDGCAWMMNDATFGYLEKNLVDSNSRPLLNNVNSFGSYTVPGVPQLLGKPVIINNAMASIGASAKVLAFGWFPAYTIRDVAEVKMEVLRERYADQAAVGVQAYARADGALTDPNAVKVLVMHS